MPHNLATLSSLPGQRAVLCLWQSPRVHPVITAWRVLDSLTASLQSHGSQLSELCGCNGARQCQQPGEHEVAVTLLPPNLC